MSSEISFSKTIYTKNALYSSIIDWEKHLKIEVISTNTDSYNIKIMENDSHKIQEFSNYVLDKSSVEEIAL